MAGHEQIIKLYSELAQRPDQDFGWDKGIENAHAHNYAAEWFERLPAVVWDYCAAVGNPFEQGTIQKGSTVVDLGCGAGVDVLVSALLVGEEGKAIGIDITPKMVEKAKEHASLAGFNNVQIIQSSFEQTGLEDESVDVVISNGAINLTSCKESVFAEIYRILKPHGKLMFADMIDVSDEEACGSCCSSEAAETDWANCVAGTLRKEKLIEIMANAGFGEIVCTGVNHYTTSDTTFGATFKAEKIPAESFRQAHWESIFQTKDYTKVFWHQSSPEVSLGLITAYAGKENAIIDVGCGASLLVDNLIDQGYSDITLLDTSATSLEIVKKRLGEKSSLPKFICTDIMNFTPSHTYDIWHDRALFHFLLLKQERERYFDLLLSALKIGGTAIISTFALGAETHCAGLEIVQYDQTKMQEALPSGLELVSHRDFNHVTPAKSEQKYCAFIIKRV